MFDTCINNLCLKAFKRKRNQRNRLRIFVFPLIISAYQNKVKHRPKDNVTYKGHELVDQGPSMKGYITKIKQ